MSIELLAIGSSGMGLVALVLMVAARRELPVPEAEIRSNRRH